MQENKIYITKKQQKLLNEAIISQGATIRDAYKNREQLQIAYKDDGCDFSTQIDSMIEKNLIREIGRIFPAANFYGEEFGMTPNKHKTLLSFVIDPIDGTKYFKNQIPLVVISVGIQWNKENIYGILFNPLTEDIIYGGSDYGIFNQYKQITPPEIYSLNKTQIYYDTVGIHTLPSEEQLIGLDFISNLQKKSYRARSVGASCAFAFGAVNGLIGAIIDVFGAVKETDRVAYSAILQGLGWEDRQVKMGNKENMWLGPPSLLDELEILIP